MNTNDAPTLADRVDRFVRWFFTASPEVVTDPVPARAAAPRSRTVSARLAPRMQAKHGGPVRVAKGNP